MNINFELFKVFYAVAVSGSISRGAETLMISQPGVTQAIKTLEEELGGILFIRTPKGVILTNEGEQLFNYIKEGMTYFVNGTNKFMALKNLDNGVINIGATATICENYLIPILREFHTLYPNVEINITNNLTDNLIRNLRNGNVDIVVMSVPSREIKDLNINVFTHLHDIIVNNKKMCIKNLKELSKTKMLLPKLPSVTRSNFDDFLVANNIEVEPSMEVVSQNLLTKLVESGFGTGLLTKEFIENQLAKKILYEVETIIKIPSRELGYATIKNNLPNFSTLKFIELLNKVTKKEFK